MLMFLAGLLVVESVGPINKHWGVVFSCMICLLWPPHERIVLIIKYHIVPDKCPRMGAHISSSKYRQWALTWRTCSNISITSWHIPNFQVHSIIRQTLSFAAGARQARSTLWTDLCSRWFEAIEKAQKDCIYTHNCMVGGYSFQASLR